MLLGKVGRGNGGSSVGRGNIQYRGQRKRVRDPRSGARHGVGCDTGTSDSGERMTGYLEKRVIYIEVERRGDEAVNVTFTSICRTCVRANCR